MMWADDHVESEITCRLTPLNSAITCRLTALNSAIPHVSFASGGV